MGSTVLLSSVLFAVSWVSSEGISPWTSVHCAVRREISPCTCRMQEQSSRHTKLIAVTCEGMTNFQQVITALQGKFEKTVDIELRISHSNLDDLPQLSFQQLGLTIHKLFLNHNNLSALPESVFAGLSKTEAFSLTDNPISDVPQQILRLMPRIKVLDLGGDQIVNVSSTDFQGLGSIHTLSMNGNCVRLLESNSLPPVIQKLTLSSNKIPSLNGTLRRMYYLEWLFLNNNDIESLDGQLPDVKPNTYMKLFSADHNKITRVPQDLKHFVALTDLILSFNRIAYLDGAISTARHLNHVELDHNNISVLYPYEFMELSNLEVIKLGFNRIHNLNGSLLPLKNLMLLNLTHNEIVDFNLQEIRGLRKLAMLDISYNKIRVVSGKFGNSVELEPKVSELRMEYNELRSLYGGLTGFNGLQRVNLSHNLLESITADDIAGLDDLLILDISYNHLTTLDGTSQIVLKSLEELVASHNWMMSLDTDFYGLPKLCWADFSHNKITLVDPGLADRTQCRLYGAKSTLRIYLQGNPAMCSDVALAAITQLESKNNTKVHGIHECPPPPPPTTTLPTTTFTTTESVMRYSLTTPTPPVATTFASSTFDKIDVSHATTESIVTTQKPVETPSSTTTIARSPVVPPPALVEIKTTPMPPKTSTTPKLIVFEISEITDGNSTDFTANDLTIPVNLP